MPRRATRKELAADLRPAARLGAMTGEIVEDESADPVGDGHSDGDLAASLPATESSKRRSSKSREPAVLRGVRRQLRP